MELAEMATDYDSPRKTDEDINEDSLQELQARRADKAASIIDEDLDAGEVAELPGADLSNELRALGVTTFLSVETSILGGELARNDTRSMLFENSILLRYVELRSRLCRLISVLKLRGSNYDNAIYELSIDARGLHVVSTRECLERTSSFEHRVAPDGSPARRTTGDLRR
jgi:hypothetical protein